MTQASQLTQPLLAAYGDLDSEVRSHEAIRRRRALAANKHLEWVTYPEEAHEWISLSTKTDFWARVERFLDRHIGPAAATTAR